VKGCCILSNFMLVQETTRHYTCKKPQDSCSSKAFNSVSCSFLLEVMQHLGFGSIWCNILSKWLRSSSTIVLVNGESVDLICHYRGLRQGDPPLAHVVHYCHGCAKLLDCEGFKQGLLQPLLRRGNDQRISLYTDNVMLFIQPHSKELGLVKEMLRVLG
jgi:hypothetical protein